MEGLIFGILRYIKGEGNLSFGSLKGPKRANSSVLQKRLSSQLPMQSNWCLTPSADRARVCKGAAGGGGVVGPCLTGKLKKNRGPEMQCDEF